jgi:hypothetical protein
VLKRLTVRAAGDQIGEPVLSRLGHIRTDAQPTTRNTEDMGEELLGVEARRGDTMGGKVRCRGVDQPAHRAHPRRVHPG